MTFEECVRECIGNRELVREFDRLFCTNLSRAGGTLALLIDDSSGRTGHDLCEFIQFVYTYIWTKITPARKGEG